MCVYVIHDFWTKKDAKKLKQSKLINRLDGILYAKNGPTQHLFQINHSMSLNKTIQSNVWWTRRCVCVFWNTNKLFNLVLCFKNYWSKFLLYWLATSFRTKKRVFLSYNCKYKESLYFFYQFQSRAFVFQ